MSYLDLKELIEAYTGLERDALHIHAALFVYLAAVLVLRNGKSLIPWLLVLAVELANEAHDLSVNWVEGPDWAIASSVRDLWNTMLWPSLLLLAGWRLDWGPRPRRRDAAAQLQP